jgi:hypothetical protein
MWRKTVILPLSAMLYTRQSFCDLRHKANSLVRTTLSHASSFSPQVGLADPQFTLLSCPAPKALAFPKYVRGALPRYPPGKRALPLSLMNSD